MTHDFEQFVLLVWERLCTITPQQWFVFGVCLLVGAVIGRLQARVQRLEARQTKTARLRADDYEDLVEQISSACEDIRKRLDDKASAEECALNTRDISRLYDYYQRLLKRVEQNDATKSEPTDLFADLAKVLCAMGPLLGGNTSLEATPITERVGFQRQWARWCHASQATRDALLGMLPSGGNWFNRPLLSQNPDLLEVLASLNEGQRENLLDRLSDHPSAGGQLPLPPDFPLDDDGAAGGPVPYKPRQS